MSLINNGNNPLLVINCLRQGMHLMIHPQLKKFLLIPLGINTIIYTAAFITSYQLMNHFIQQLIPAWLTWLNWLLWPVFFISFAIIVFFSFSLLANLIAAPYYSRLAAQTRFLITGKTSDLPEASWRQIISAEWRRIRYLLFRLLPLSLLFLIPLVNLIAPILWSLFAAWGVGLEYLAYPLENQGQLFPEQQKFIKRHRIGVLCFGGLSGIALSLPVINLLAAPVAVIAAVIYVQQLSAPEEIRINL